MELQPKKTGKLELYACSSAKINNFTTPEKDETDFDLTLFPDQHDYVLGVERLTGLSEKGRSILLVIQPED